MGAFLLVSIKPKNSSQRQGASTNFSGHEYFPLDLLYRAWQLCYPTMRTPQNPFWNVGDQTKLAEYAHITPANLNSIIHRKRRVSWRMACRLEEAAEKALGKPIPAAEWINPASKHPAFDTE
jgi:DNA-binding transcriptional regulator YdaS (Cro superfamily)